MRSLVCAALAFFLVAGTRSARADEQRPLNTVTTNPARFGILHFQVEYERVVANRWSVFVSPIAFYHATWYPFAHEHGTTAWGGGVDLGTRWYLSRASLEGV